MRSLGEIALSAKTAALTAGATVASGLVQLLGLIPDEIGKLTALVGLCIGIVTLGVWRKKSKEVDANIKLSEINEKKAQIELELLILQRDKIRGENENT